MTYRRAIRSASLAIGVLGSTGVAPARAADPATPAATAGAATAPGRSGVIAPPPGIDRGMQVRPPAMPARTRVIRPPATPAPGTGTVVVPR